MYTLYYGDNLDILRRWARMKNQQTHDKKTLIAAIQAISGK